MSTPRSPIEPSSASHALDGWRVYTLRPAEDAQALVESLRAVGATASNLPLLRLLAEPAQLLAPDWSAASADDRWIFVSPAAVRHAASIDAQLGTIWFCMDGPLASAARGGRVFAPGPGTAHALEQRGILPIQVPAKRMDSEGLLALPGLAAPVHGCVRLIAAAGSRDLLPRVLRQRGARICTVHVYRRIPQPLSDHQLRDLTQAEPAMLVVSSLSALRHYYHLVPEPLLARQCQSMALVVASERIAHGAGDLGFQRLEVADSALPEALLAAVLRARSRFG